jgi:hypothetical protein
MMKIWKYLKWNPLVPFVLFGLMLFRAWYRGFPLWSLPTLAIVAFWLCLAIYRFFYRRGLEKSPLPVLSDEEVASRIGKDWYDRFSLAQFGCAWVSPLVFKTSLPVEILFRDEPDTSLPWSGWTIITGMEDDWRLENEIELSDVRRVLRQRPDLATYLDLPVGTTLSLKEDGTYEIEKDEDGV